MIDFLAITKAAFIKSLSAHFAAVKIDSQECYHYNQANAYRRLLEEFGLNAVEINELVQSAKS